MNRRFSMKHFSKPLTPIFIHKDDPDEGFVIHVPWELVPYLTMDIGRDKKKLLKYANEAAVTDPYMKYVAERMELVFSDLSNSSGVIGENIYMTWLHPYSRYPMPENRLPII